MPFPFRPSITLDATGNIVEITGLCRYVARHCLMPKDEIEEFTREVVAAKSNDAAWRVIDKWFNVDKMNDYA